MRILLVSDLHYTLKQFDWVASVASEYDLVVVAGDSLSIASPSDPGRPDRRAPEYLWSCRGTHTSQGGPREHSR